MLEQFSATFYIVEKRSGEPGRNRLVRNSIRWNILIYNLMKNRGKLGACSVKILRESRRPIYGTERIVNGIKVSLVVQPDFSVRLMVQ